jgi:hypothetical protein
LGDQRSLFFVHDFRDITSPSTMAEEFRQSIATQWDRVSPRVSPNLPVRLVGSLEEQRRAVASLATALAQPECRQAQIHLEFFGVAADHASDSRNTASLACEALRSGRFTGVSAYLLSTSFNGIDFRGHAEPTLAALLAAFALTESSRSGLREGFNAVRATAGVRVYLAGLESFTFEREAASAALDAALWLQNYPAFSSSARSRIRDNGASLAAADHEPKLAYLNRCLEPFLLSAASRAGGYQGLEQEVAALARTLSGVAREAAGEVLDELVRARTLMDSRAARQMESRHATEWVIEPVLPAEEAVNEVLDVCPIVAPLFFAGLSGTALQSRLRAARRSAVARLLHAATRELRVEAYRRHEEWFRPNASPQGKLQILGGGLASGVPASEAQVFALVPPHAAEDLREEIWTLPDTAAFLHLLTIQPNG